MYQGRGYIARWKAQRIAAGLGFEYHDKAVADAHNDIKHVLLANSFLLIEKGKYGSEQIADFRRIGIYMGDAFVVNFRTGKYKCIQLHILFYLAHYWNIDFIDLLKMGRELAAKNWQPPVNWRKPRNKVHSIQGTAKKLFVARAV